MSDTMQSLDQLASLKTAVSPEAPKYVKKVDKYGRAYATSRIGAMSFCEPRSCRLQLSS